MLKKYIIIATFLLSTNIHAETCPSVADIKAGNFKGWQAYDLNDGDALSESDLVIFRKNIQRFAYTIWLPDAPEGSGQCHYIQKDDDIEAYLAKPTLEPDKTVGNWHLTNYDMMQCDNSIENCRYLDFVK